MLAFCVEIMANTPEIMARTPKKGMNHQFQYNGIYREKGI